MLARLLLVALAVVAAVVAVGGLRRDARCQDVTDAVYSAPAAQLGALARAAVDRCGDPRDRAVVAVVLVGRGHRREAARVGRAMTRANPDEYLGWLVLGRAERDDAALRRAHALNPLGVPAPR